MNEEWDTEFCVPQGLQAKAAARGCQGRQAVFMASVLSSDPSHPGLGTVAE